MIGSKFGAVLDMVLDRATTTGLIIILAQFYPERSFIFITAVAVDIISHYAHLYRFVIIYYVNVVAVLSEIQMLLIKIYKELDF